MLQMVDQNPVQNLSTEIQFLHLQVLNVREISGRPYKRVKNLNA
jgi:hypothetical protein